MDTKAWLIELPGSPPKWWSVSENGWTTDSLKAIQFQKRHHAEGSIASDPVFAGAVATEHIWQDRLEADDAARIFRDLLRCRIRAALATPAWETDR